MNFAFGAMAATRTVALRKVANNPFRGRSPPVLGMVAKRCMGTTIVEGVEFDTIAREWRCKWSADNDKQSLSDLQKVLNETKADIQAIDGVKSVQRIVCGGCLDFKVIIALEDSKFGGWQESDFAPEASFLEKIQSIDGVSLVETQTYTLMPVES